jgi:hypothetical protein
VQEKPSEKLLPAVAEVALEQKKGLQYIESNRLQAYETHEKKL